METSADYFISVTGSHVAQAGLKPAIVDVLILLILLPPPPRSWDYKYVLAVNL